MLFSLDVPTYYQNETNNTLKTVNFESAQGSSKKCKEVLWNRWSSEYLKGLRDRHNLQHRKRDSLLEVGNVAIIKAEDRNKGKWRLRIVEKLIAGKDGLIRGATLRSGKSYIERQVQHLYPLELSVDRRDKSTLTPLNAEAPQFRPRRPRLKLRLQELAQHEEESRTLNINERLSRMIEHLPWEKNWTLISLCRYWIENYAYKFSQ